MWVLPSVTLNSCAKSMLGTCPHPLVEGVLALRPLKRGVRIESPLALLDPSYRDRMTSFKVLLWGLRFCIWSRKHLCAPLERFPFLILFLVKSSSYFVAICKWPETVMHSLHQLWPVLDKDSCLALELLSPCGNNPSTWSCANTILHWQILLIMLHGLGHCRCHVLTTKWFREAQFTLALCSLAYLSFW